MRVGEITTPLSVVLEMLETTVLGDIDLDSEYWHYSRVPVYTEGDPDNIVGVALRSDVSKALLRGERNKTLRNIMLAPDNVSEDMYLNELLKRFIITRRHLFCVRNDKDEYMGIVTLEDIIESLIGEEIVDELDIHEDMQEFAKRKNTIK